MVRPIILKVFPPDCLRIVFLSDKGEKRKCSFDGFFWLAPDLSFLTTLYRVGFTGLCILSCQYKCVDALHSTSSHSRSLSTSTLSSQFSVLSSQFCILHDSLYPRLARCGSCSPWYFAATCGGMFFKLLESTYSDVTVQDQFVPTLMVMLRRKLLLGHYTVSFVIIACTQTSFQCQLSPP